MRVIAGTLGGRIFDSPKSRRTHPMSDKARGALFNALGDISGWSVLDAFAGSGALGFEAISRGAATVTAIEIDPKVHRGIIENAKNLGIDGRLRAVRANCVGWSQNNADSRFDLVLVAPPYDSLQLPAVQAMAAHLASGGRYVLDWPGKLPPPNLTGLELVKAKAYGDAQLAFYKGAV